MRLLLIVLVLIGASGFAQSNWNPQCTDSSDKNGNPKGSSEQVCIQGNLKSVRQAIPNEKGHYHYTYQLLQNSDYGYKAITVQDLLNDNSDKLLERINQKIGLDYLELLEDPMTRTCITKTEAPSFSFEQLGFFIDEFGYHFRAHFDVSPDCEPVDASTVSFSPDKMRRYLKK